MANGNYGTDHGVGKYAVMIGDKGNGGIYGNMFLDTEIPESSVPCSDIEDLTSYEHIFARICEHLNIGSADSVMPGWKVRNWRPASI